MEWFQQALAVYNRVRPVIDITILAFLIYKVYDLLVKTQAVQLIKGAGFLALIYAIALILDLATLQWVLNLFAPGLLIAVSIVFQPELRKIIMRLGQGELFRLDTKPRPEQIEAVVAAAELLAERNRGAIMVFPRRVGVKHIIETGTLLNAELSSSLIMTIFAHDGPLHDGAVLIQSGKVLAAGCLLPLSEQQDIRKNFGTRHRAALGLSEQSDAIILVVSEETGSLSLAYDSKLYYDLSAAYIERRLKEFLGKAEVETGEIVDSVGGDFLEE